MKFRTPCLTLLVGVALIACAPSSHAQTPAESAVTQVHYGRATIDGTKIFYREAGPKEAPVILLLHGFPTSSHMFRELIGRLSDQYHVIAPDYPGFGYSDAPDRSTFAYTFANYASLVGKLTEQLHAPRYALYVMDYGAPVGFRLATEHPERVTALIIQNGNAYDEGFGKAFWSPIMAYWKNHGTQERESIRWLASMKATHWQYTNGVKDLSLVSPDAEMADQALLDRPGNADIQLDLLYDYRTNVPLYPQWHAYFRKYAPPTLIMWGQNDEIFVAAGAEPYKRDIPNAQIHMLDTGHFALETHGAQMAQLIREFMSHSVTTASLVK